MIIAIVDSITRYPLHTIVVATRIDAGCLRMTATHDSYAMCIYCTCCYYEMSYSRAYDELGNSQVR